LINIANFDSFLREVTSIGATTDSEREPFNSTVFKMIDITTERSPAAHRLAAGSGSQQALPQLKVHETREDARSMAVLVKVFGVRRETGKE
jgi:hypothetical protein